MNDSKISVRYAKALFQTAVQKGSTEAVKSDMDSLLACINSVPEFKLLLESPVISGDAKMTAFGDMFKSKVDPLTMEFFKLLVQNKRENYLKMICLNFGGYYNSHNNIKKVSITTAVAPPASLSASIEEMVLKANPGCKVQLSTETDESIIGGIIIGIDDKRYDASVKTQLSVFKDKLINNK